MYGQGRVSLALWCRAGYGFHKEEFHWLFGVVQGMVFSKTWVKNQ
jgi:hypothetical protein